MKAPETVPLAAQDVFIHGALLREGGTCASLPVVYAAVGRRLGYPIRLANTQSPVSGHLFARWDEPGGERFNIDVNDTGLSSLPDDFYRSGDFLLTSEEEETGGFLRSMTAQEELAQFLLLRGSQWQRHQGYRRAIEAFAWAAALMPQSGIYLNTLRTKMYDWQEHLNLTKPPVFPALDIRYDRRRYPDTFPRAMEEQILGLEATENLL